VKKKPIKPNKILKKPTGSVRFRFYKPETKKTGPNPNRKKNQKKNRAKPKKSSQTGFCPKKPNRTELKPIGLNWFWFFKKKFSLIIFLIKTESNRK
jgi:hypothetical protein